MELARASYEATYAACWRAVYRTALAWTNDAAEAEDLAQEALLRLWKHRASIDWDGAVRAWLLVTVRHLATDRLRHLKALSARRQRVPMGWDEALTDEWLDVRRRLGELRPAERAALVLTAVEGLSSAEVGGALGVSAGAARALASRARRILRERE